MERTDYFNNPGALKIDLMLRGIRVADSDAKARISDCLGIDVLLPMDTLVNIPCLEEFASRSPYELTASGSGLCITDGEGTVPIALPPMPELYSRKTSTGVPISPI